MTSDSGIPGVTLGKINRMLNRLYEDGFANKDEVSFEFVIGSLFPNVADEIKDEIRRQYTRGYMDGITENGNLNTSDTELN